MHRSQIIVEWYGCLQFNIIGPTIAPGLLLGGVTAHRCLCCMHFAGCRHGRVVADGTAAIGGACAARCVPVVDSAILCRALFVCRRIQFVQASFRVATQMWKHIKDYRGGGLKKTVG